ncbi:MAG: YceD family protein [Cyclobacteriaceae bacterium]
MGLKGGFGLDPYSVHIQGLSYIIHHFHYDLDDAFFKQYGQGVLSQGAFQADVTLDKRETFIEATFQIQGNARLVCDRSLDEYDQPMRINRKIIFKFGDENKEISDDLLMIHRNTDTLKLGHYLFEFIGLELPMKKLHPRFSNEEESEGIVYTSGNQQGDDPRWDVLKKLKN